MYFEMFFLVISYYLHERLVLLYVLFLKFSSVIWCPYYVNEIKKIEAVQRTFTKSIGNFRLCAYHERLSILKIDSLQCRRFKMDLIMCYKILYCLVDINSSCFFCMTLLVATRLN